MSVGLLASCSLVHWTCRLWTSRSLTRNLHRRPHKLYLLAVIVFHVILPQSEMTYAIYWLPALLNKCNTNNNTITITPQYESPLWNILEWSMMYKATIGRKYLHLLMTCIVTTVTKQSKEKEKTKFIGKMALSRYDPNVMVGLSRHFTNIQSFSTACQTEFPYVDHEYWRLRVLSGSTGNY